jgi:hypothetical protein
MECSNGRCPIFAFRRHWPVRCRVRRDRGHRRRYFRRCLLVRRRRCRAPCHYRSRFLRWDRVRHRARTLSSTVTGTIATGSIAVTSARLFAELPPWAPPAPQVWPWATMTPCPILPALSPLNPGCCLSLQRGPRCPPHRLHLLGAIQRMES